MKSTDGAVASPRWYNKVMSDTYFIRNLRCAYCGENNDFEKDVMSQGNLNEIMRKKEWYTGCCGDLRKRFKEHNHNRVVSTKGRGPFKLIYYEACINQQDAYQREKYLKSGPGKRYINNRLKRFLSLTG